VKKIWLMGGFGNVLFQVLLYRVIKSKYNVRYIDILTKKNILTILLNWKIHEISFSDFIPKNRIKKINSLTGFTIIFIAMISKIFKAENGFSTYYDADNKIGQLFSENIFGYFQYKSFLEDNKKEIIRLGSDIRKKYKSNKSYTVVHFRLGDSKRAKKMISYYEEVRKMILESNEEILIATDSPKEAEIFFKNCPNVRLSGAKNALEDFKYMVNSKRLYCAPSTFSWWALHSLDNDSSAVIPEFFKDDLGVYINEDRVTIY
jgi:hypothetical protein